jgi:hypothetical protein
MSVVAAATIGSAALGYASSQEAAGAQNKSTKVAKKQLKFEMQQFDRWESIYGGLEENLGDFYGSLTPEFMTTQGLQQQQQTYQESLTQIREQFAQTGVTSGAQADIEARGALDNARTKATIRAEAPFKVAEQQQSFLNMGIGQGAAARQGVQRGSLGVQQAYQTEANIASQEASDAFGAAASFATTYGRSAGLNQPPANVANTTALSGTQLPTYTPAVTTPYVTR